jgi:hypothetical protein
VADEKHPVEEFLRAFTGDVEPDASDRAYVEERLAAVINAEKQTAPSRWPRRRVVMGWAAAVAALVVGIVVFLPTAGTTPAEAAMEEIARAAESVDPTTVTDQEFVYTRSENLALRAVDRESLGELGVEYDEDQLIYQLLTTRETWFGSDNTVRIRTTVHEVRFFNETDQTAYQAAGLAEADQVGETETITVELPETEEWPTDPNLLDQTIRERMTTSRGQPDTVEYLELALTIIREGIISPELRAAALRLIGGLDGLNIDSRTEAAHTIFFIEYTDSGVETRYSFAIDEHGYLRHEQRLNLTADPQFGISASTIIHQADYTQPTVTDSPNTP